MLKEEDIGFITELLTAAIERFIHRCTPKVIETDQLRELQRLVWLLANIVNRGPIGTEDPQPRIEFAPGIADRGNWVCRVHIDFSKEGEGRGEATLSGTIDILIHRIRKELSDRLGPRWYI